MTTSSLLGRQGELLAQLRDLLILPSSSSPPASKQLVSAVRPLAGAAGPGPPPPAAAVPSTAMAIGRRHRRRESSKRGRDDEVTTNGEHPVAAAASPRPRRHYCKRSRRTKQVQRSGTSMVVTSAPDLFDGYQWRKYGQKLIEGAMYPRSYYRCARSAEQGCAAKRTVQRNNDAADGAGAAAPKYTVVRVGEHTCTANDSPDEAPVILETTAVVVVPGATSNSSMAPTSSSAAASCSTTTAGTESPAISDNALNSSRIIASSEYHCSTADDCHGLLAAAVHDNDWVPGLVASSPASSFPGIEDFAGPIRSPVHVSAADGWMFDQFLQLQFVNDPAICQHV